MVKEESKAVPSIKRIDKTMPGFQSEVETILKEMKLEVATVSFGKFLCSGFTESPISKGLICFENTYWDSETLGLFLSSFYLKGDFIAWPYR